MLTNHLHTFHKNRLCYFLSSFIVNKLIVWQKKRKEMKHLTIYSIWYIYVTYQKTIIFIFMFLKNLRNASHPSQLKYLFAGFIRGIGDSLLLVLPGKLGYIATAENHSITVNVDFIHTNSINCHITCRGNNYFCMN